MTTWVLKKDRMCRNCGEVFERGTVVGRFLAHVQRCRKREIRGRRSS
jgi:hypothetical protein